jgi:methylase of polypeptide subunit release factors
MAYPTFDRGAATVLGQALRRAGYSESAVSDMLGDDAWGNEADELAVHERRLAPTPLGTVVRALFLQLPVDAAQLARALGGGALEALRALGFIDAGASVRPRARILPVGELLVASDDHPPGEGEVPQDYVAAYTPTSRLCDCLTPRRRGEHALDVGSGSGVQAVLAARHARHVVATDVNQRALTFTELNAALNGFANVETRRGSLFDAVAGEQFDVITCNAPYVISPENRWAYRDSGLRGDEITRRVLESAAAHLAADGFATVIGSWLGTDEEAADERPYEWAKALPECDTWILSVWESDPLEHAASWNREHANDSGRFPAALDSWTGYLAELGAGWVSEGAILLHRRAGRRQPARIDGIDEDALEEAGDQVRRAFEARARLAALRSADDLLDERVALAMRVALERELDPRSRRDAARVQLVGGTSSTIETTADALGIVERLDGTATLRRLLRGATADSRRRAVHLCRELLELGAARFATTAARESARAARTRARAAARNRPRSAR